MRKVRTEAKAIFQGYLSSGRHEARSGPYVVSSFTEEKDRTMLSRLGSTDCMIDDCKNSTDAGHGDTTSARGD